MALTFEWDQKKAELNNRKHSVTFEEATTVFGDPLSLTIYDPVHSDHEERFVTIGKALNGKLLVVVHTDRNDNIRIINSRLATSLEKRKYEES